MVAIHLYFEKDLEYRQAWIQAKKPNSLLPMQCLVLQSQKRLRYPMDLIMECTIPMFTVNPINSVQQGTLTCADNIIIKKGLLQ